MDKHHSKLFKKSTEMNMFLFFYIDEDNPCGAIIDFEYCSTINTEIKISRFRER